MQGARSLRAGLPTHTYTRVHRSTGGVNRAICNGYMSARERKPQNTNQSTNNTPLSKQNPTPSMAKHFACREANLLLPWSTHSNTNTIQTISKAPSLKSDTKQHKEHSKALHNQRISKPNSNSSLQGDRTPVCPKSLGNVLTSLLTARCGQSQPWSLTALGKKYLYQLDVFNILPGSMTSLRQ